MNTLFLPILLVWNLLSPTNFSTETVLYTSPTTNLSTLKVLPLEGERGRFLIESLEEVQQFQICNLTIGETYTVRAVQSQQCQSKIFFPDAEKHAEQLNFMATEACQTILFEPSFCEDQSYLSVWCTSCNNENEAAEWLQTLFVDPLLTAEEYVPDFLFGCSNLNIENVQDIGHPWGQGVFLEGDLLGIEQGVIISTGDVVQASWPNIAENTGTSLFGPSFDEDLSLLSNGQPIFDVSGFEFDFTPTTDILEFNFVFASEEYCEYINSNFNDPFGVFISGPGINGPFSQNAALLTLVPGTGMPVSINSINPQTNAAFFQPNAASCGGIINQDFTFDGFHTPFIATAFVVPFETYHIRFVIADVSDGVFDSAVFFGMSSVGLIANIANPDPIIFTGDPIVLDGSNSSTGGNFTYAWTGPNGFTSNSFPFITVQDPGIYCLAVTNIITGQTCTDCVEIIGGLEVVIAPPDTLTCDNPSVLLEGSVVGNPPNILYEWVNSFGVFLSNESSIIVSDTGIYCLRATDTLTDLTSLTCVEVISEFGFLPAPPIIGPDTLWFNQTGYFSSPFDISFTAYEWSADNGTILLNEPSNEVLFEVAIDSLPALLCLQVYQGFCPSEPTCIVVNTGTPIFNASISGDLDVCSATSELYWLETNDTTVTNLEWVAMEEDTLWQIGIDSIEIDWSTNQTGAVCAFVQSVDYGNYQVCETVEITNPGDSILITVDTLICPNFCLDWNGILYCDPGTYLIPLGDGQGCDSTLELNIQILETTSSIALPPILGCGGDTILLDGSNSTQALDSLSIIFYTWTGPGTVGAGDQNTIQATLPGTYCLSVMHERSNLLCESVTCVEVLEDNNIPEQPEFSGATLVCDGDATQYTITNTGGAASGYTWITPNGELVTTINNTTFEIIWASSVGGTLCVTADNACGSSPPTCLDIQVAALPILPVLSGSTEICENAIEIFTVNNPDPNSVYEWTAPSGATISSSNEVATIDFTGAISGEVCVTAMNNCGNTNPVCLNISIENLPEAPLILGFGDPCIDVPSFFMIDNADPDLEYHWTTTSNASINGSGAAVDVIFSNSGFGEICVVAESACGASQATCLAVEVLSNLTAINQTIECQANNVAYILTFEVSGGSGANFEALGAAGTFTGNTFISEPLLTGIGYAITVTDASNCNPIVVEQNQVICDCTTEAGTMNSGDVVICNDGPLEVIYSNNGFLDGNDILNFVLYADVNDPIGSTLTTNNEPIFFFDPSTMTYGTTYFIAPVAGNDNGNGTPDLNDPCLSFGPPINISFEQSNLQITLTSDTTICDDSSIQLTAATTGIVTYEWSPASTLSCTECPNPIASPNNNTSYSVTATDAIGCSATEEVQIFVQCLTVFDTIPIGGISLQSLNLPPWEIFAPADVCPDEDDGHISFGFSGNGTSLFYVGLSPGTDTLCILLEHPSNNSISETFTFIITVTNELFGSSFQGENPPQFSQSNNAWQSTIQVFPNPAQHTLQINGGNLDVQSLQLFSLDGKLIKQEDSVETSLLEMNVQAVKRGIYFLKIETEKGMVVRKVILVE